MAKPLNEINTEFGITRTNTDGISFRMPQDHYLEALTPAEPKFTLPQPDPAPPKYTLPLPDPPAPAFKLPQPDIYLQNN